MEDSRNLLKWIALVMLVAALILLLSKFIDKMH